MSNETVNVVAHSTASILILEAMLLRIGKADLMNEFGMKGSEAEVELKVNGVAVPVVQSLEEAWLRLESVVERRAKQIALRMVTEAGLEPIAKALREAEQSIRNKLELWDEIDE